MARQEVLRTIPPECDDQIPGRASPAAGQGLRNRSGLLAEAIDSTHTPEFEQLEGIVMDKSVTFCHLLGILKEFYGKMGFEEVRFRPGYFPTLSPQSSLRSISTAWDGWSWEVPVCSERRLQPIWHRSSRFGLGPGESPGWPQQAGAEGPPAASINRISNGCARRRFPSPL